jgi:hypothetical protein
MFGDMAALLGAFLRLAAKTSHAFLKQALASSNETGFRFLKV